MSLRQHVVEVEVRVGGQGLHAVTEELVTVVADSGIEEGMATVYLRHTSASLVIQENAAPSARRDLEAYFARLVPEGDPLYTHTAEGPDDMPAHVKAALTNTSESIPVVGGRPALGTWQGLFLWEHRHHRGQRRLVVHVLGC